MFQNNDWDMDEDYFDDFNTDEVVKVLKEKKETESCTFTIQPLKQKYNDDNLQLRYNSEEKLKDSLNTGAISHKNVVLNIFKNNENIQKNSYLPRNSNNISLNQEFHNVSKELPTTEFSNINKKHLILNILKKNDFSNIKTNDLKNAKPINKSLLKVTNTHFDNDNKFKRKKSVSFNQDTVDKIIISKKMCISDENCLVSKQIDNFIKSRNSIKIKKQTLLKNTVTRKFPGPAGLLIDDSEESEVINLDLVEINENKSNKYSDVCSQNTKKLFTMGAWQLMMEDLPVDFELQDIATVKENASEYSKKYKKVPYLAGIIQYIDYKPNNPHIILKDFSGKIDARVHHSICKLYPNALGTNTVILLKDVGVIVTSKKYVCIIISPKNLISLYSDDTRLVQTPEFQKLLDSKIDFDLQDPQINLQNHEYSRKSKTLYQNDYNHFSKKNSVFKINSNIDSLSSSAHKKYEEETLLKDPNNSIINGFTNHFNSINHSKITDFVDDIQDFDFQDESSFAKNIDNLNFLDGRSFESSTPMIKKK